jgi:hypothetical protein
LDDRRLLAVTTPVLASGDVVFNGDSAADFTNFSVEANGFLHHNRPVSEGFDSPLDLDSVTAGVQSLKVADITSLTYNDDVAGLNDTVHFTSEGGGVGVFNFNNTAFTALSVTAQHIGVRYFSAINTFGAGAIEFSADGTIWLFPGSSLTTVDGGINLVANDSGTATGPRGINVERDGISIQTTGTGNILLSGKGGTGGQGVNIGYDNSVSSTMLGETAPGRWLGRRPHGNRGHQLQHG